MLLFTCWLKNACYLTFFKILRLDLIQSRISWNKTNATINVLYDDVQLAQNDLGPNRFSS